jgi:hypothetical protein
MSTKTTENGKKAAVPAWAKKVAEASANKSGTPLVDGNYLLTVVNLIVHDGYKGTSFIAEMVVDESSTAREGIRPNAPGTRASYVVNLTKNEMGPGNAKSYILALLGKEESEISDEDFIEALQGLVTPDQPARGPQLRDSTFFKNTKDGRPFTGHNWSYVDQTEEEVAARRAEIDG